MASLHVPWLVAFLHSCQVPANADDKPLLHFRNSALSILLCQFCSVVILSCQFWSVIILLCHNATLSILLCHVLCHLMTFTCTVTILFCDYVTSSWRQLQRPHPLATGCHFWVEHTICVTSCNLCTLYKILDVHLCRTLANKQRTLPIGINNICISCPRSLILDRCCVGRLCGTF